MTLKKMRIKIGLNKYSNNFKCSFCRKDWDNLEVVQKGENGGIFLRIDVDGNVIDFPICPNCTKRGFLETMVDCSKHNTSHPLFLA